MDLRKESRIIIVGAGVFGLSTAFQLANEGYSNIIVLDRSAPPVPDGSSVDISRIIRFDYSDIVYARMAKEAYNLWLSQPEYTDSFHSTPFLLVSSAQKEDESPTYAKQCMETLRQLGVSTNPVASAEAARKRFPAISGLSDIPGLEAYYNENAGWADAAKAISRLKDDCIAAGVSLICGSAGTVVGVQCGSDGAVTCLETETGKRVEADIFIFATGAWSDSLIDMNHSVLSTAQCVGYLRLTDEEMNRYKNLPIFINFDSGYFCFPPHRDTNYLKMAVHGYGYTNSKASNVHGRVVSSPFSEPVRERKNFIPDDARERLHTGLVKVLPELKGRGFEKAYVCWYTDTISGDFIMDFHPRHRNLFIATGGSGHAFKFLPVLGKYVSGCLHKSLAPEMLEKWRFNAEEKAGLDGGTGDGSKGGPERREFAPEEKDVLAPNQRPSGL